MRVNSLARDEGGFTLVAVIGAITLVTLLVTAAFAATNADLNLTSRNLKVQRAYAAAQAGINAYSFHLGRDNSYWTECTGVPTPNAVNQQGSTANRLPVPGFADASYAIELLPATGSPACDPNSPPFYGMLEQSGSGGGTFRIRSTGFVGGTQQSVVATFKRAAFLDYVYFTQFETSDPVTYGFPNPSAALTGAYSQCGKFRRNGREGAPIPNSGGEYCDRIVFVDQDRIDGPLHTNDDLAICGSPDFGRDSTDVIEVSSPPQGWIDGGCAGSANPNFIGPFATNAPVLTPPATNGSLRTIAGPVYTFTGQTTITLSGSSMTVNGAPVPLPPSGVIYVANAACSTSYTPFTATYPPVSGCGNAIVHGDYSGQLTVAAENDIIVDGSITRDPSSNGMLGLIANNFVRIKHPICPSNDLGCSGGTITAETDKRQCNGGVNGTGSLSDLQIDAANLAINHSFIVDHYDCGADLGTLQVNGTITQKYRGAVGTVGGTGYFKDYNYDDRLRHQEPPHFLDPVQAAWHVQRETLDNP
jgi:type II secretory pathway pseudopilin PulG